MDVVSDALRVIRLKGALFLNAEFREPWCVTAPSTDYLRTVLPPAHQPMAICHLIVEGRCWASVEGSEPVAVEAGEVITLPRGDAHLIGGGPSHAKPPPRDVVPLKFPEVARMHYGGGGVTTIAICGWFHYDLDVASPVMGALPRLFRTSIRKRPSAAWLESSIRYAAEEAASGRPGGDVLAAKLAEILFVEALRGYIEELPANQTGWLAALRDPLVGRAIERMHERPAEAWTVASLAQAVSASRTVLADRFTSLVGVPPMQYLTQWRVALAARLLRGDRLTLGRIAEQVGYESEAAFSRAFKREYGKPPATWRRQDAASLGRAPEDPARGSEAKVG